VGITAAKVQPIFLKHLQDTRPTKPGTSQASADITIGWITTPIDFIDGAAEISLQKNIFSGEAL
jgi:hypothetical protein